MKHALLDSELTDCNHENFQFKVAAAKKLICLKSTICAYNTNTKKKSKKESVDIFLWCKTFIHKIIDIGDNKLL